MTTKEYGSSGQASKLSPYGYLIRFKCQTYTFMGFKSIAWWRFDHFLDSGDGN